MRYLLILLTALACCLPTSAQIFPSQSVQFVKIGDFQLQSSSIKSLKVKDAGDLSAYYSWNAEDSDKIMKQLYTTDDFLVIQWHHKNVSTILYTSLIPLNKIVFYNYIESDNNGDRLEISLGMLEQPTSQRNYR